MPEHKFTYKAKDLIAEFDTLLMWLDSRLQEQKQVLADLSAEIKGAPAAKPFGMGHVQSPSESKASDLTAQIARLELDKTKAQLWLHECKRKPSAEYTFDFSEIAWLRRYYPG